MTLVRALCVCGNYELIIILFLFLIQSSSSAIQTGRGPMESNKIRQEMAVQEIERFFKVLYALRLCIVTVAFEPDYLCGVR